MDTGSLWVPPLLFYVFSAIWLTSYLRLIFTDISSQNYYRDNDEINLSHTLVCKKCRIYRRQDIYHCTSCNVCSELHDHHCDIINVCICAKNYKYFIQFLVYAALLFINCIFSLVKLNISLNNEEIRRYYGMRNIIAIVVFAFFSLSLIALCILYLENGPFAIEQPSHPISRQIRREEFLERNGGRVASYRSKFCIKYCGSQWNVLKWILPI